MKLNSNQPSRRDRSHLNAAVKKAAADRRERISLVLKDHITRNRMSQTELAARLMLDKSTISKTLSGEIAPRDKKHLKRWIDALGITGAERKLLLAVYDEEDEELATRFDVKAAEGHLIEAVERRLQLEFNSLIELLAPVIREEIARAVAEFSDDRQQKRFPLFKSAVQDLLDDFGRGRGKGALSSLKRLFEGPPKIPIVAGVIAHTYDSLGEDRMADAWYQQGLTSAKSWHGPFLETAYTVFLLSRGRLEAGPQFRAAIRALQQHPETPGHARQIIESRIDALLHVSAGLNISGEPC